MNRSGFTLIELLIVVVIIGILAAIAIPKFANTKEKAYIASEKSDLPNLINAQEAYFPDNTTYASALGSVSFNQSAGVTVTITSATGSGWTATSWHNGTSHTCYIAVGGLATTREGAPICP
jgi:prepilin-type N-terminal cleavage/methylation domain-containing protein